MGRCCGTSRECFWSESDEDAARLTAEIEDLRRSGKLAKIIDRMWLD